ncbi:MAG: NAD(P)/FAD-dependent oxidoreductase [Mesorhizobium sp.]
MLHTTMNVDPVPRLAAERWLAAFEAAISQQDEAKLAALFGAEAHWRDVLALSWHVRGVTGTEKIVPLLLSESDRMRPHQFRLAEGRAEPRQLSRVHVETIEAIFSFETEVGYGTGVVRLVADAASSGQHVAWTFMTSLEALYGFEGPSKPTVARGFENMRQFGGENWLDRRIKSLTYEDREPTVLVVGAGHAGLGVAARLGQMGVDALIVDREERIGDNWRTRYHSLTLHNEVWVNHMPFMPFPENWPTYLPKDKLANWMEAYVEAMELNVWTRTEFVSATYDETAERWTVILQRNGQEQVLHPHHVILATGASGIPNMPKLPGLDTFAGKIVHSSKFADGQEWAGRKAIVIGTGTSSHDVAQELHASGAHVTMVQRGTTQVVSMEASAEYTFPLYREGLATDDADRISLGTPFALYKKGCQIATSLITEMDRELIDQLSGIGFKVDLGFEETGYLMSYLLRGGGYYFNVGCSDLLINGEVDLIQWADVDRFGPEGLKMADGTVLEAELVVLGTGYHSQSALIGKLLGQDVADKVGEIWGFSDDGEVRNIWKATGQPGLWLAAGSLAQCRIFSRILALQIKARELGLVPRNSKPGALAG